MHKLNWYNNLEVEIGVKNLYKEYNAKAVYLNTFK